MFIIPIGDVTDVGVVVELSITPDAGHFHCVSDMMAILGATKVKVPPWTIGNLQSRQKSFIIKIYS